MGCRNKICVHEEVYAGSSAEIHIFKAYMTIIYSNSHTYVGFLKETRVHQKTHFQGMFGHFQTLVSSKMFYLTELPFQQYRDEVKWCYKYQVMGPPIQVFFQ